MSRKRVGVVLETEEYLDHLASEYAGTTLEPRITMLRVIKSDPNLPTRDVALRVGACERTIRRWWGDYRDCLSTLLSTDLVAVADGDIDECDEYELESRTTPDVSARFLRFLNTLPMSYDVGEWTVSFRDGLANILDGVDRVTVAVDVTTSLDNTTSTRGTALVTRSASRGDMRARAKAIDNEDTRPSELLYEEAKNNGFPFEDFYPPSSFDYYSPGGDYLGSILLWSRRGRPTPRNTIEFVESMRGFITTQLTDCALRYWRSEPDVRLFREIIDTVADKLSLRGRLREVFTLLMFGIERDEIASRLRIARSTTRKHITQIYRRADTRNFHELFARYLIPLASK